MLSFDDSKWLTLEAGYHVPVDLRPLLQRLETGSDPDSAWDALWGELHHQGDVGPGSYVAVPHLVRIHRVRNVADWNIYALIATIELARDSAHNPDVPEWARADYDAALSELGEIGREELPYATSPEAVRSILGILAIIYGVRVYGRVLAELTEDEVAELLGEREQDSARPSGPSRR